jgi:hypothetical protein
MEKRRQSASAKEQKKQIPPLMKKSVPGLYKESFPLMAEAVREQYEKDGNPIRILYIFREAVGSKLDIPSWVIKNLNQVFQEFLYDKFQKKEHRSLDRLMGFKKGKGQAPAEVEFELRDRNVQLMTTMGMLIQRGMKVTHAAQVAFERNLKGNFATISIKNIRKMYYRLKNQVQDIRQYQESPKDVFEFVPESIKKRYPHIFSCPDQNLS